MILEIKEREPWGISKWRLDAGGTRVGFGGEERRSGERRKGSHWKQAADKDNV
jgi:hypothetical protein